MVFSSLTFLLGFLPLFLGIYYIAPNRAKNLILFVFSLLFYSWGEPKYVIIMLFSTILDFTCGIFAEKFQGKTSAKIALIASIAVNLGMLCVFKYGDFLIGNFNALTGLNVPLTKLALPIGISFYTFQTMSYTIDVYRGEVSAQKNIISFGAYVSLFPQLIAGPIVRYKTIAEQLNKRVHSFDKFGAGVKRFVVGLGKKVLLANNIGLLWEQISSGNLTVLSAWLGLIAFGFQIYFDFSGYSDMAIGLGKMLGFDFDENFNYPFISKSITEFWRRWHISLGTWFRDYVYIPLGGNRKFQVRNILIVWLLTGIWHGAAWNFLLWGAFFGIILIAEKFFLLNKLKRLPAAVGHFYSLFLITVSWLLFAVEDFGKNDEYFRAMFGANGICDNNTLYLLLSNLPLLILCVCSATPLAKKIYTALGSKLKTLPITLLECSGIAVVMMFSTAHLIGGSYNPFLYFRF